ncbi:MAG: hypothetical protein AB7H70_01220 [Rhodospirillaceae bacterium]
MRSLKDIRRIIESIPRPALKGIGVLLVTAALFALSFVFLGGARDNALAEGRRLNNEITTITKSITQTRQDIEYVEQNKDRYETLIKSDKLIPHTRRAALAALRDAAVPHGLENALNFTFGASNAASLEAATSQPASGAYRVNVEAITLKISAPLDGPIYRFIDDVAMSFPGSLSLESLSLSRAPEVNESLLSEVSLGNGGLVTGDVLFSWRTAQKEEEKGAAK